MSIAIVQSSLVATVWWTMEAWEEGLSHNCAGLSFYLIFLYIGPIKITTQSQKVKIKCILPQIWTNYLTNTHKLKGGLRLAKLVVQYTKYYDFIKVT